jgi:hypothetical protein
MVGGGGRSGDLSMEVEGQLSIGTGTASKKERQVSKQEEGYMVERKTEWKECGRNGDQKCVREGVKKFGERVVGKEI